MWHALLTLLLIESQITWTVASSVDFPLDGHSNSGQDDLEEGSYSRTAHQDDHNRQTQNRHENTNVKDKWQESRERIQKLQELQDKFADVQMTLMAQLGTIKRHLSWKTPSLPASQCKDDHGDRSDEGTSWAAGNFGAGTLYVNWGNTVCPMTARKMYEGIVGGAWSVKRGEEVDSQCLPNDSSFPTLESNIRPFYPDDEIEGRTVPESVPFIYHGMPCVVCRVTFRSTVRMLIGKPTCTTSDWTLEYAGRLMASLGSKGKRTDFLCVDKIHKLEQEREYIINSENKNSRLDIESAEKDAHWSCAVCTK